MLMFVYRCICKCVD